MKKGVKKPKEKETEELNEGLELCPKCGSQMIWEEGEVICPDCDGKIDFFGDKEDEKDA